MSTTAVTSKVSDLPAVGSGTAAAARNELGKDSFLKLLTTQMQNQDPLSPMDNQQFIAQLAQFSSVEQLGNVGTKLDSLLVATASQSQLQTASLVGKQVLFKADRIGLVAGQPSPFQVTLGATSDDTVALVADRSGRVVRTLQLGPRGAGSFAASWDGLDDRGNALPSGEYVLTVSGTRKDGTTVPALASIRGTVTGVTFENQAPELLVAGRHVRMSEVVEIATPSGAGA